MSTEAVVAAPATPDPAKTRGLRALIAWMLIASAHRLTLLGRYHPSMVLAARHVELDIVHGAMTFAVLTDGLATDLASWVLLVVPLLGIAWALDRFVPRARRVAAVLPLLPLGAMTIALLMNVLAYAHTGGPLDFRILAMFHDVPGLSSFLYREAGGVLPLIGVLGGAFCVPALVYFALQRWVRPPTRAAVGGFAVIVALVFVYVARVAVGGAVNSFRGRVMLATIRQYEDPSWRLVTGALWVHFSPVALTDLTPQQQAGLRPLLTPGDDSPAIEPRFPLFRKWKPLGDRAFPVPAPARPLNVVLVLMESNSAADVGALGDPDGNTPRFDALAKDGMLFSHFYSNGTTSESGFYATMASIPSYEDTSGESGDKGDRGTLIDVLDRHGWHGAFVVNHDTTWAALKNVARGLELHGVDPGPVGWGDDRRILDEAAKWAESAPRPYFLSVFTASHHSPWTVPDPAFPAPTETDEWSLSRHALRYQDQELGKFVDRMRALPDFQDTVFVFVGDHGSHIRPHGTTYLGGVGEEAFHVPMLLYAPGRLPAMRDDGLASQVDLAPTIVDLLGIDDAEASFTGRSLLRRGAEDVYSSTVFGSLTLALVSGDMKVIFSSYSGSIDALRAGSDDEMPIDSQARADIARKMAAKAVEIHHDTTYLLLTHAIAPPP